jgi:hypothetical protein
MRIVSIASVILISSLFSEIPYEFYRVKYNEISRDVLKNTIGILTINSGTLGGTELRGYSRAGNRFSYDTTIKVEETIPISNFDYQPRLREMSGVGNYRYPIVGAFEKFMCITYDPKKNLRTWISLKETEEKFEVNIVMLDSMLKSKDYYLDIFYSTESGRKKVYNEPKMGVRFHIISKDKYSLIVLLGQKNGFLRIGYVKSGIGIDEQKVVESPGWIRIRDDKGLLTIWIKYVDLC